MPLLYIALILGVGVLIMYILRKQAEKRRSTPGEAGYLEYRTDLAFDECLDALNAPTEEDEFVYTCRRDPNGSFWLNLTLHQPTRQPMDTLFSLRMDAGRQTVVTLHFIREAFGYDKPVFPQEMLDRFLEQKLKAHRTK